MTNAYQEIYVSKAQSVLGDAFDYAINTCGIKGEDFIKMFIVSEISTSMENGEPKYLAGKSGIEIVREIVFETTGKEIKEEPQDRFSRSSEYWAGWAIAYYQWWSSRKYADIFKVITFEDLQAMYYTLHEADITKFVDVVDERIKAVYTETNLKRLRTAYGCSQSELAKLSGVSLRSIQMYEQRNKDINNASASTLNAIAKVLGCTIEDLLEHK